MTRLCRMLATLLILGASLPSLSQQKPGLIVGLVGLSGTGATSGTNFDNCVKLAVKEINAAGGILGRRIEYTSSDFRGGEAAAITQQVIATLRLASAK